MLNVKTKSYKQVIQHVNSFPFTVRIRFIAKYQVYCQVSFKLVLNNQTKRCKTKTRNIIENRYIYNEKSKSEKSHFVQ